MPRKKKEPVNVATEERVTVTEVAAAQQAETAKYGISLVRAPVRPSHSIRAS